LQKGNFAATVFSVRNDFAQAFNNAAGKSSRNRTTILRGRAEEKERVNLKASIP
jgi:hypothetical protein